MSLFLFKAHTSGNLFTTEEEARMFYQNHLADLEKALECW